MDRKQDPEIHYLQKTHFRIRDTHRLKVKGPKQILHANCNQRKVGVTILVSDKTGIKSRDKESHYIMIKGSVPQENITIVNIYTPKHSSIHISNTDRSGEIKKLEFQNVHTT